jgi:hypothetical protein
MNKKETKVFNQHLDKLFVNLTTNQQTLMRSVSLAADEFLKAVKPESDIEATRRVAFLAGFFTCLKNLGIDILDSSQWIQEQ